MNFFFIVFSLIGFCILHWIYVSPLSDRALERLSDFRKDPFYSYPIEAIGAFPNRDVPTNYLKVLPDKNKVRIGFFGDSNTAGSEVKPGHDFPSVLQEIIGPKYQVINFGKAGFNSNQLYLTVKHFSRIFDLDVIVLGPRGFYTERATTFNNYWNQGALPYARFILKNKKLQIVEVPGKNTEEKIKRYYGVLPSAKLIQHDHVSPSILKLIDRLFNQEVLNPFFRKNRDLQVRSIQRAQLQDLSESLNTPIIHYTDFEPDCEEFKSIKAQNYSLECVEPFTHVFPYRAEVSHPSSFGHFLHAQNLIKIILKEYERDIIEYSFIDDDNDVCPTRKSVNEGREIDIKNLSIVADGVVIANLSDNWGYQDTTGRLINFSRSNDLTEEYPTILLGLYIEGDLRANALFLKIPERLLKDHTEDMEIEWLCGIRNIGFLKIRPKWISHPFNKLYFTSEWLTDLPIDQLFTKGYESNELISYFPKFPSYKMVIDKDISAVEFFSGREKPEVVLEIKENN
jgi:hypothetical protein